MMVSHTALMVSVCHGFGGKVPSYGEWKAGHQGGGAVLYIYLGEVLGKGADVEKWSWSLWVRRGTTVRQIVHT